MNKEPNDTLEVSKDVVEQLNGMVRNGAASVGSGQAPRSPGPAPSPAPKARYENED